MDFSLRTLEQLIAVVDEGSFTRAAERMNVAQPWLSARIRKLEELTGFVLLDRSTRRIRPTADGEVFLIQARTVVREACHLTTLSQDMARGAGTLRVGAAPYTYFVPERQALLEGFAAANPQVMLEIENHQDPELRQAVLRGDLDAAIVTGTAPEECEALLIRSNPLWLLIPREHPLATYDHIPLHAIVGLTIAAGRRSANPIAFDETCGRLATAGAQIMPLPEPNRQAQVDFARRHRLILATLSDVPVDNAANEDALVMRAIADPIISAALTLIRRRHDVPRRALARFWSYAAKGLTR